MRRNLLAVAIAVVGAAAMASAQAPAAAGERFGLGTFQYQGKTFFGLVVRDSVVVDLAAAAAAAKVQVPTDMMSIIQQYDSGVGDRLKAVVKNVVSQLGANRPAYAYDLKAVKALSPFTPTGIVQARSNYLEHFLEMGGGAARQAEVDQARRAQAKQVLEKPPPSMPGYWPRAADDRRQNPYLFSNVPTIVTGDGDPIEIPIARSRIDYECELAAVMGARPARRVSPAQAKDFIFGYANMNDVTDREGRSEGGSDWLIGKAIDTFKPWGPYVVPKEFVDPLNTPMRFTLSGRVLQDDNSGSAIHNIYELVQYASNLFTLKAGNLVVLGTPSGVGTARKPPVYMKPGDTAVCTYEGMGTLTNPVVAERTTATSSSQ
jgi:2-keto-4-pentenoate hydratase/2-oxohepta-3-ene-1,7-dioic acid hydratase in catechol pathway